MADITEQEFAAALERGRVRMQTELRAAQAHYDRRRHAMIVLLTTGVEVNIPCGLIREWAGLSSEVLEQVAVSPAGFGMDIDAADISIGVDELMRTLLGGSPDWALAG